MIKIGKWSFLLFWAGLAHAVSSPQFSVSVDRNRIGIDEAVSLKFQTKSDGQGEEESSEPSFSAPDFDVVNEFSSQSMQSFYNNGQFGMQSIVTLTKILKPKHAGQLRIFDISAAVGGQKVTQPPITIEVLGSSVAPQPRAGRPGNSASGDEEAAPIGRSASHGFFVRAEVDENKVVTGQQVTVSYYLYRRVQLFNIAVDKFPVLNGFLREDLEMPIQGQRLESEPVMVNGVPYQRSLLVRYAAYPLKEGRLPIDSMGLKFNYYARPQQNDDEDPMMGFFRQMAPLAGTASSDPVMIQVSALPEGKPAAFSGAVGSFQMVSTIDKEKVKAGEPVTLVLKIEGRGNLSGVEPPVVKWPDGVQVFDTKGRTTSKGLHAEKIFEYIVIPKNEGKLEIPAIEISYFDPKRGTYSELRSDPFHIDVAPGDPAAAPAVTPPTAGKKDSAQVAMPSLPSVNFRLVFGVLLLAVLGGIFARWVIQARKAEANALALETENEPDFYEEPKRRAAEFFETKTAKAASKGDSQGDQQMLKQILQAVDSGQGDLLKQYDRLGDLIFGALDRKYGLAAKTRSRSELGQLLQEKGMDQALWAQISEFFEFAENARFGVGTQDSSEGRLALKSWVTRVGEFIRSLS